jgi:hypothetical protein
MVRGEADAVLREELERIVAVVRQPVVLVLAQTGLDRQIVLVDLPGDAVVLEQLRKRPPTPHRVVVALLIADDGLLVGARLRANGARPEVAAVRRRAGQRRAEVLVTDRERVGQRVVERDVGTGVVTERQRRGGVIALGGALGRQPPVIPAAVAGVGLVGPAVWQRPHPGDLRSVDVEAERQVALAGGVGLRPDRQAVGQRDRPRVVEPADTAERAERVVERAVLLHENDDVFCVEDGAARRRLDGRGASDRAQKATERPGRAQEELASRMQGRSSQADGRLNRLRLLYFGDRLPPFKPC